MNARPRWAAALHTNYIFDVDEKEVEIPGDAKLGE